MNKFKSIILQFSILFISLFFLELSLRFINSDMMNYDIEMWRYANELKTQDSILGHKHLKDKSSVLQGVEIKLNSRGMRSSEFTQEDSKILFLGSSISLGWGVQNNDSYPQIIQKKLISDSLDFKVLNGSIGNYNTFRYINSFLSNQIDISPELIVVNYFINDVEILPINSSNWLIKNSQLFATLKMTFNKLISKSGFDLKSYYKELYKEDSPSLLLMKESLFKLSEYSKKNNIPVLMCVIPDIHFLEEYPFEIIHQKMRIISEEFGFEYHDLLSSLKGIPFSELQIIPGDSHPNELGHLNIAESLYPRIKVIINN